MDGNGERISRIKQEKIDILGIPKTIYNQTYIQQGQAKEFRILNFGLLIWTWIDLGLPTLPLTDSDS